MNLSVTFIDCLIVLIVVVSAGYAAWRGFLWETLTIFAWVTASFGCLYFGPFILPLTKSLVSQGWLAGLLVSRAARSTSSMAVDRWSVVAIAASRDASAISSVVSVRRK